MDKEIIKELLELVSQLNHRQWEMLKMNVDIAFSAKFKDEHIEFDKEVTNLISDDLINNG